MAELMFHIVTPKKSYGPYLCDSVRLTICDDANDQGGGSCGIRKGHAKSLMTLDAGSVMGLHAGETVVEGQCGLGFATVDGNSVTAVVESFVKK